MSDDECLYEHVGTPQFARLFALCSVGWIGLLTWARRSPRRHATICLAKAQVFATVAHVCIWRAVRGAHFRVDDGLAIAVDGCGCLFLSFEAWDLLVYQVRQPKLDREMIVHHALHIALGLWLGRHCHARLLPMAMLLQETSTIFLNVRFLCSPGSTLHAVSSAVFAIAFVVYRNLLGWLPLYVLWRSGPAPMGAVDAALCAAAFAFQLRWGRLVVRKVVRVVRAPRGRSPARAHAA